MNEKSTSISESIQAETVSLGSFIFEFQRFNEGILDQTSVDVLYSYLYEN